MRSIGLIGLQQSRFKASKSYPIEQAAKALGTAGYDVEVDIDDMTLPATTFAEQEGDRVDRAEQRADRYSDYVSNARPRRRRRSSGSPGPQ